MLQTPDGKHFVLTARLGVCTVNSRIVQRRVAPRVQEEDERTCDHELHDDKDHEADDSLRRGKIPSVRGAPGHGKWGGPLAFAECLHDVAACNTTPERAGHHELRQRAVRGDGGDCEGYPRSLA